MRINSMLSDSHGSFEQTSLCSDTGDLKDWKMVSRKQVNGSGEKNVLTERLEEHTLEMRIGKPQNIPQPHNFR